MKCSCSLHSPFLFRQHVRPSLFATDPAFCKGASSGKTMAQIQSDAMTRFEELTGRSAMTMYGISDKADKQAASYAPRRKRSAA